MTVVEPEPEAEPQPGADGKFTQDDLKRIAAREKREGKASGRREMLKDLGVETEDELKNLLQQKKDADEKALSDAEKARKKAEEDSAKSAKERGEARQDRFDARCERALLKAGVPESILTKAIRLVDMEWDSSQEVPDLEVFDEAVGELKKSMPQLFTESKGGPPPSDPGAGQKGGTANPTGMETGQGMLASRHPKTVKTGN